MVSSNPQTGVSVIQHIAPASHVADVTPTNGVDCRGFRELLVIYPVGTAVGAASVLVTLQESSVIDGTGDAFAAWTGSAFAAVTTANDAARHIGRVYLPSRKRFIRALLDYTGNGTTEVSPSSVIFVLMHPEDTAQTVDTYALNA